MTLDDWKQLDWTKRDVEIARATKRTRERVRQVRRALGRPDPANKKQTDVGMENLARYEEWFASHDTAGMSIRQVADALGVSHAYACQLLRQRQLPYVTYPSKVRQMNFDLPGRDLAEIWGTHYHVPYKYRCDHGLGPAKWDARENSTHDDPEYRKALAEERRKARAFKQERTA